MIEKPKTKQIRSSNNACLELYIQKVTEDLLQYKSSFSKKLPDNIPQESRKELYELEQRSNIVIRPVDKGSKFFIMDREDYVRRVTKRLSDTSTYERVSDRAEAIVKVTEEIRKWTIEFQEEPGMSPKIINWLIPNENCKPGNNYINPKAHKLQKGYLGRLISTGCASYTKNLAALTANELSNIKLDYGINDTSHLLRKIDEINNRKELFTHQNLLHVSFDVVNMFPSISKDVGLQQCRQLLEKHPSNHFSTEAIVKALDITLEHNITEFEFTLYRQCKGAAMGPKNACVYADIAMNYIDEQVMNGEWPQEFRPLIWARFRDDIYLPWTYGEPKLYELLEFLNTRLPGIEFTVEHSYEGIAFLDTFIYSKNNRIHTKIFSKECNDHKFLIPTSCHPTHILRNIPYNTALRIYKITSDEAEYTKSKEEYKKYLLNRRYSDAIIAESFEKAEKKERQSLYNTKCDTSKSHNRCFPLVCDYNPGLPNIGGILNKHKHILDLDDDLKDVINKDNIFALYRGTKTIKDILTHSKLRSGHVDTQEDQRSVPNGECKKCNKQCYVCKNYLIEGTETDSYHTNTIHSLQGISNCSTKCVVYMIMR